MPHPPLVFNISGRLLVCVSVCVFGWVQPLTYSWSLVSAGAIAGQTQPDYVIDASALVPVSQFVAKDPKTIVLPQLQVSSVGRMHWTAVFRCRVPSNDRACAPYR